MNTLTGGNPAAFCERAPGVLDVIGAWALASVVSPPSQKGFSDLAYGPGAVRAIASLDGVAPAELAERMKAARDRAGAATQALRDLGLDQATIDGLADMVQSELSSLENPEPSAVQSTVLERIRGVVGDERLKGAAQAFWAANPEPPGLFDLGEVPDDVARDAGYACLAGPGG